MKLAYDRGTIVLKDIPEGARIPGFFRYDPRKGIYRALAMRYRDAIEYLSREGHAVEDGVLSPPRGSIKPRRNIKLRPYQLEALRRWRGNGYRGVVVLPTGAGKTRVGLSAIGEVAKPTLIVVPTLELLDQWARRVERYFLTSLGIFGGGRRRIEYVTISTYDSAYINAELLGNKFYLVIFDEVHHLPSPGYRQIAELLAAPYRMGLTATPEREDGAHVDLPTLVGPVVYEKGVSELAGRFLSDFEIKTIGVRLSDSERREYERHMSVYRSFLKSRRLRFYNPKDFEKLIMRVGLDREAREALLSWREARRIAFNASKKLGVLSKILSEHRGEKVLIFTDNNEVVRRISLEFLIPEITYKTPKQERRKILELFKKGDLRAIVTSRVLEEGIDVPDANVAIIISGTGSSREFIQRLGRILRPSEGKRAILYEIVTVGTGESRVSRRRKRKIA